MTTVIGAPWTILRLSRRSDRGDDKQKAEQRKRGFHGYSFGITLNRATSDRQLSSCGAECNLFTPQYYVAARSESFGLQQAASETAVV